MTITMGEDGGAVSPEKKEVPIWMQKSTVEGVPLLDGGDSSVIFLFFIFFVCALCVCLSLHCGCSSSSAFPSYVSGDSHFG